LISIAAQQSLFNLFAGIFLLARPVHVGDRVSIRSGPLGGEFCGDVTEIGITYITLNTSDGPEHLPNSQVLAAALRPLPQVQQGAVTPETGALGNGKSAVWNDEGNDRLNGRRRKVHEMGGADRSVSWRPYLIVTRPTTAHRGCRRSGTSVSSGTSRSCTRRPSDSGSALPMGLSKDVQVGVGVECLAGHDDSQEVRHHAGG
jgi:hypothetical protein